jgi:putative NADPH-quinone reductase
MKNLIVIGHPDQQSFCYNGIFSTIKSEIEASGQELEVIDLYRDSFTRPRTAVIDKYKKLVTWAEWIYIVSPVWWFRLTPRTEIFFDEVMTPGFAYQFVNITKTYAYPKPFLKDKKIRTYVTHGAPSAKSCAECNPSSCDQSNTLSWNRTTITKHAKGSRRTSCHCDSSQTK